MGFMGPMNHRPYGIDGVMVDEGQCASPPQAIRSRMRNIRPIPPIHPIASIGPIRPICPICPIPLHHLPSVLSLLFPPIPLSTIKILPSTAVITLNML